MSISNLFAWNKNKNSFAAESACGASDKSDEKPSACGSACGADDKPSACGASDK